MNKETITLNAEITPPLYGLPRIAQDVIAEVTTKRQMPVESALAILRYRETALYILANGR